ncbi:MAG: phosphomethylpyrimidine synthase ThiC [Veillonellaceae bacterium]|nr:phosphomethylpyrimidine synthase ThiC [Veillonellaceae bacterium]
MATQMQLAREGKVTDAMRHVAEEEHVAVETVRERVAKGTIAICANVNHLAQGNFQPRGVGEGLRTKVNANIGTSSTFPEIAPELEKLDEAVKCGADAVMDLSTGDGIDESRRRIIEHSPVMVGTVPLYQATVRSIREHGAVVEMTDDDILETIEAHAKDGADFMTLHCGVTRAAIEAMRAQGRVMDIVSRGGSFIAGWMLHNEQENPLYEHFDDILDICERYDVTISLGDGMRPGCTADATDRAQITELITLGSLVDRAWRRGVQVMVEGPGHVPFDQIKANMQLEKRLCRNAPFYVLGPLVTDIAPGYDHITSAIGGTLAAASGADFLCYVTPAEHLALPTIEDVHTGVITARIAAHAADLVKDVPGARDWDRKMAEARKELDWKAQMDLAIDPELAREKRGARNPEDEGACSMCGDYCAVEIIHKYFDKRECPFDD